MKKKDFQKLPENSVSVAWLHLVLKFLKDDMDKVGVEEEAERRDLVVALLSDLKLASPIV
jgi:hypothetical protein